MQVNESTDYKFLSIFADKKSHNWFEVIYLGTIYLDVKQSYTEQLLRRAAVDNSWLRRTGSGPSLKEDTIVLTEKGDQYYRSLAIRRNPEEYRTYRYFNREQESSGSMDFGLDKIAPLPRNLQKIDGNSNGPIEGPK